MKTVTLKLWVDNQSEVGLDWDATTDYIRAAHWRTPAGVTLDGQTLAGESEAAYAAFRALADAVAEAGHGDTEIDAAASAPNLTACPSDLCEEGYTSAGESLARLTCRQHASFRVWMTQIPNK